MFEAPVWKENALFALNNALAHASCSEITNTLYRERGADVNAALIYFP